MKKWLLGLVLVGSIANVSIAAETSEDIIRVMFQSFRGYDVDLELSRREDVKYTILKYGCYVEYKMSWDAQGFPHGFVIGTYCMSWDLCNFFHRFVSKTEGRVANVIGLNCFIRESLIKFLFIALSNEITLTSTDLGYAFFTPLFNQYVNQLLMEKLRPYASVIAGEERFTGDSEVDVFLTA